jgi:Nitroreductase family
MNSKGLLEIIQKRRSVRVYKTGKVTEAQLELILEAARWVPRAPIPSRGNLLSRVTGRK